MPERKLHYGVASLVMSMNTFCSKTRFLSLTPFVLELGLVHTETVQVAARRVVVPRHKRRVQRDRVHEVGVDRGPVPRALPAAWDRDGRPARGVEAWGGEARRHGGRAGEQPERPRAAGEPAEAALVQALGAAALLPGCGREVKLRRCGRGAAVRAEGNVGPALIDAQDSRVLPVRQGMRHHGPTI